MAFLGIFFTIFIIALHWLGFSWNHIVILGFFGASIFFGALVIADNGEEEKDKFSDFGKPAKKLPGEKNS